MQGVLGVTATKSGNLLTPMMVAIVIGTFICGQATLRLRSYKTPVLVGSVLVTIGTILFARLNVSSRPSDVILGMIAAGFGMGLMMPAYTVARAERCTPESTWHCDRDAPPSFVPSKHGRCRNIRQPASHPLSSRFCSRCSAQYPA
jgi:MFS family permease